MSQPSTPPQQPEQKYPEFKFRTKPVQERSVWESYAVLPARTRLYISLGITAFAAAGLFVSDQLEKVFPPEPTPPKASSQQPSP
ncbi:hypothetical protein BV20DRAFT_915211, partial [Pilatotrama ljubarskyi]